MLLYKKPLISKNIPIFKAKKKLPPDNKNNIKIYVDTIAISNTNALIRCFIAIVNSIFQCIIRCAIVV